MKILFVHQIMMSFVEKDLSILRGTHKVRECHFQGVRDLPALLCGVWWCNATFSWFGKLQASWAVLFSKILSKKAIVVAGGDDVAREPGIGYGMFCYWWKKWCPLFVFRYADLILSVSECNRHETIENARANPKKIRLLYHGFDPQKWQRLSGVPKENLVLTVGRITKETFSKKGLDVFVQSAAYLPDVPFVIVGPWKDGAVDRLKAIASSNVVFIDGLYGVDLVRMYSRARVYVQASVHESFGCSVAEAMLCECTPVVTRRTALREVVSDCGFYVDYLKPESIAKQIKEALSAPEDLGKKARERIKAVFPLEKRKKELLEAIESFEN